MNGICLYFLRTTPKAITPANIAQEVNFGKMDCSGGKVLKSFEGFLSKIILPAMKSLEVGFDKSYLVKKLLRYFLFSISLFSKGLILSVIYSKNLKFKLHLRSI